MIYAVQMGMVLMGLLPNMTLLTVFLLPLGHLGSILLESNFDKGVVIMLLHMWLMAVFMTIGVLL